MFLFDYIFKHLTDLHTKKGKTAVTNEIQHCEQQCVFVIRGSTRCMTVHTAESMIHCSSARKLNNLGQFSPVYFSSEPIAVGTEERSVMMH